LLAPGGPALAPTLLAPGGPALARTLLAPGGPALARTLLAPGGPALAPTLLARAASPILGVVRRGLYAIVDPERCGGRSPLEVAEAILRGGCAYLQLRAKSLPDRARLELARALRERARRRDVPFIVNDRPDLALLAEADGLHLGQDDLGIAEARRIVGAMPIGRSTHNLEQARAAVREGADLIGLGPIYPTRSKRNPDPVVGVERLCQVVAEVPVPVVAIGGIDASNAAAISAAGAPLAAVISAIGEAPDPESAARTLHRILAEGR
jgi:thiamine-phosphate diphosphorylase